MYIQNFKRLFLVLFEEIPADTTLSIGSDQRDNHADHSIHWKSSPLHFGADKHEQVLDVMYKGAAKHVYKWYC